MENPASRFIPIDRLAPPRSLGGMGRAFVALDRATAEEVTLVLSGDPGSRGSEFVEAVTRARRIATQGLPSVLAGGIAEGCAWQALAWSPGIRLTDLVASGPLPEEAALRILWELSLSLSVLHQQGLFHGDIHPGNVILTPEGFPVLVGFVAPPLGEPLASRPAEERVPRHAAPEWHENRELSPASDVYSLALVAYQIFTGRPLLPPGSSGDTLRNQERLQIALDRAGQVTDRVPAELDPVLLAMLEITPENRPGLDIGITNALVPFVARWASDRPPSENLGEAFLTARRQAAARLLEKAASDLAEGRPLASASSAKRAAELVAGDAAISTRIGRISRDALWASFLATCERPEEPLPGPWATLPEGARREAVVVEAFRTGLDLGDAELVTVARHRLAGLADPDGPLGTFLPGAEERTRLERRVPTLLGWLAEDLENQDALLALACSPQTSIEEGAPDLDALKGRLLAAHGSPGGAAYYLSRRLRSRADDPEALAELARVLAPGAAVPRPEPAPAPDPLASLFGEVTRTGRSPARREGVLADAEVLFSEGQVLSAEGKVGEAAGIFLRLVQSGPLELEQYRSVTSKELRRLLWTAFTAWSRGERRIDELTACLELARVLEDEAGGSAAARILAGSVADGEAAAALERASGSPGPGAIELASARVATLPEGPDRDRMFRLLAECLLAAGEPVAAHEAQAGMQRSPPDDALTRRIHAACEDAVRAVREFDAVEASTVKVRDPAGFRALEARLASRPGCLPIEMRLAWLAAKLGMANQEARIRVRLAARRFRLGDPAGARREFRRVLDLEPSNDDALLGLVDPDALSRLEDTERLGIAVALLRQEGLLRAAIHHARRRLRGGARDAGLHALLVDLCREIGEDAAPHMVALGQLALREGDEAQARRWFEEARVPPPGRPV